MNKEYSVWFTLLTLGILFGLTAVRGTLNQDSHVQLSPNRTEKFLSLFTVVRFENTLCTGNNSFNGTCLTNQECRRFGGLPAGSCASGFGVCCTFFELRCGKTISQNNTYWQNSGTKGVTNTPGQCTIDVLKSDPNICQIRLDLITFLLASPDTSSSTTNTQCLTDVFTVSGGTNIIPGICGTNPNRHMYVHLSPSAVFITLNMVLTGTTTSRAWNIKIAQIPCGTPYTAPNHCLQYYMGGTGTILSFGYDYSTTAVQKQANEDYTVCIRTNQGFCGVMYMACTGFSTGGSAFLLGTSTTATAVDSACANDWIQIPCAIDYQSTGTVISTSATTGCSTRLCGAFFSAVSGNNANAPVYSYRKPFEVRVYTDSYDASTSYGIGFCLNYFQQPCTPSIG